MPWTTPNPQFRKLSTSWLRIISSSTSERVQNGLFISTAVGYLSRTTRSWKSRKQSFTTTVRAAVDELRNELDEVLGIVLYGSVARGKADRRSDIDLWVLVEDDRMEKQRTANRVRQDLEDSEFDTGRYAYEIDVEALPAIPSYTEEIRIILSDGLVLYDTEKFDTVQQMIFHGDLDK